MATSLGRRAALGGTAAMSLVGRRPAPVATPFSKLTGTEKERLTHLLIRDIARNLGIEKKMNEEFGVLEPEPGDDRLRASANAFQRRMGL
jgi:hypothetical protein